MMAVLAFMCLTTALALSLRSAPTRSTCSLMLQAQNARRYASNLSSVHADGAGATAWLGYAYSCAPMALSTCLTDI